MTNESWYTVTQDQDGHHYVIPWDKRDEWNAFCESESYGYEPEPKWAIRFCEVAFQKFEVFGG